ncbi:MAG: NAD(P)H-dependent oxidoreductase [Rhodothermales bacterium]
MSHSPNNPPKLRVLGFAGSIREGSYNRALLQAAMELAPDGVHIEPYDLAGIPFYNGNLDKDGLRPEEVERFKKAISDAGALLVVTPEYNSAIPGVLQNAIDWASRPAFRSPLAGKAVAIMGASPGAFGTTRGQEHLKLILMASLALVMPHPGVAVNKAADKFNDDGQLTDQATRGFIGEYLVTFQEFVHETADAISRKDPA